MRIPRGACPHWLIRTPLSTLVTSDRVKQCALPRCYYEGGLFAFRNNMWRIVNHAEAAIRRHKESRAREMRDKQEVTVGNEERDGCENADTVLLLVNICFHANR